MNKYKNIMPNIPIRESRIRPVENDIFMGLIDIIIAVISAMFLFLYTSYTNKYEKAAINAPEKTTV